MSYAGRRSTSVLAVILAQAAMLGVMACVPDVVRWDTGKRPEFALGTDVRLVLGPDGSPAAVARWTPPAAPAGTPACATSRVFVHARGDTAFAAWWAPRPDSAADLVVARSNDGGRTWRAPVVADSTDRGRSGCRRTPIAVAVDSLDGYIHVVYFLAAPEGAGVFCTHSMEGGTMFHAPVPIVYGDRASAASIATWGDTVAVAYEDPNASVPQVWLAISHTTGHIFEQRTGVSSASASSALPAVALRGSRIAVAWYETQRGGGAGKTILRTGTIRW
jgi:hypothetical protein